MKVVLMVVDVDSNIEKTKEVDIGAPSEYYEEQHAIVDGMANQFLLDWCNENTAIAGKDYFYDWALVKS